MCFQGVYRTHLVVTIVDESDCSMELPSVSITAKEIKLLRNNHRRQELTNNIPYLIYRRSICN